MQEHLKVDKIFLDILNQVFEIDKKVSHLQEPNSIRRNINKLKEIFENEIGTISDGSTQGFTYYNPVGEFYNETRTDCDASIAGLGTENLEIKEVIKPIIYYRQGKINAIVQKAVVVVESKSI